MIALRRGQRRSRTALVGACAAVALFTAACGGSSGSNVVQVFPDKTQSANGLRGAELTTPIAKPAVTLTDVRGKPYALKTATAGSVTLLFFGYTNCPDVCPTTMADLAAALQQVKPDVRSQVKVVFVTTDPARDTKTRLLSWLRGFDPSFVGLTGTWPQIAAAAKTVNVDIEAPEKEANGTYTVTHGAQVLAFTKDGQAHEEYLAGTQVADYVHDLPRLVEGKTSA